MDNVENINLTIEKGIKELVVRKGEALELHNPKNINISGTISAPSKFITDRSEDFEKNESYALVSRENKTIVLFLNEQLSVGNYEITGTIKIGNKFTSLNINSETSYTPEALSKKLKMLRSIFPKKAEHAKIVSSLRNLKATVNQIIEKDDDTRGNITNRFVQTVESNMPESFKIKLPLLEGEEDREFDVNVILEADSSHEISCYLESIDAADLIEKEVDKRLDEEIAKINEFAVVIER